MRHRRELLPAHHVFSLKIADADRALLELATGAVPGPENSWAPRLSLSAFVREAALLVARGLVDAPKVEPATNGRELVGERIARGLAARRAELEVPPSFRRSAKDRTRPLPFEDVRENATAKRVTQQHASAPKAGRGKAAK